MMQLIFGDCVRHQRLLKMDSWISAEKEIDAVKGHHRDSSKSQPGM